MWGRGAKGNGALLCSLLAFSDFPCYPQANWAPLVMIPEWVGLCTLQDPVGLSNELSYETGSFSGHHTTHRCFQSAVLRLYFPAPEPWVEWCASLPSCSSWFICTQMWDCPLHQPQPHRVHQLLPSREYSPLLLVWVNVSSLTPWLSDFHTFQFSGSSGYFLFLNLLLSFWSCEEAQCIYLHLPLGCHIHSCIIYNIQS